MSSRAHAVACCFHNFWLTTTHGTPTARWPRAAPCNLENRPALAGSSCSPGPRSISPDIPMPAKLSCAGDAGLVSHTGTTRCQGHFGVHVAIQAETMQFSKGPAFLVIELSLLERLAKIHQLKVEGIGNQAWEMQHLKSQSLGGATALRTQMSVGPWHG